MGAYLGEDAQAQGLPQSSRVTVHEWRGDEFETEGVEVCIGTTLTSTDEHGITEANAGSSAVEIGRRVCERDFDGHACAEGGSRWHESFEGDVELIPPQAEANFFALRIHDVTALRGKAGVLILQDHAGLCGQALNCIGSEKGGGHGK